MQDEDQHRWAWLWFGIPASLFCVVALIMLAGGGSAAGMAPAPVTSGPFTLSVWQLPKPYELMTSAQYIGGGGLALSVGTLTGTDMNMDTIWRVEADPAGSLRVTDHLTNGSLYRPEEVTADGGMLVDPDSDHDPDEGKPLPPTPNLFRDILPLSSALRPVPLGRFDLGFHSDALFWYNLLDSQQLAVVVAPGAPGGTAELRIVHLGTPGQVSQAVPLTAVCGDAWNDGPSLGIITRDGKLFLLDRVKQRMVEQPAEAPLAAAALAGNKSMVDFAYSGSALVTESKANDKLRLFALDGSRTEIKLIETNNYLPSGASRSATTGYSMTAKRADYARELHMLQREGHGAPADVASNCEENELRTFGAGLFAYVDPIYARITVIRVNTASTSGPPPGAPATPALR